MAHLAHCSDNEHGLPTSPKAASAATSTPSTSASFSAVDMNKLCLGCTKDAAGGAVYEQGGVVIPAGRDDSELAAIAAAHDDSRWNPIKMDVTDEASVTDGFADLLTRFGRIDGLVNNSGVLIPNEKPAKDCRSGMNHTWYVMCSLPSLHCELLPALHRELRR
jgi:hypothetical protein